MRPSFGSQFFALGGPTEYGMYFAALESANRCGSCGAILQRDDPSAWSGSISGSFEVFLSNDFYLICSAEAAAAVRSSARLLALQNGYYAVLPNYQVEHRSRIRKRGSPCVTCQRVTTLLGVLAFAGHPHPSDNLALVWPPMGSEEESFCTILIRDDLFAAWKVLEPELSADPIDVSLPGSLN